MRLSTLSNTKDDQKKEILSKGISLSFCSNEICELAAILGKVIKNKTIKLAKTIRSYNKFFVEKPWISSPKRKVIEHKEI